MPLKTKAELEEITNKLISISDHCNHRIATDRILPLLHTLQTDAVKSCAEMVRVQPIHSDFSLSHPNGEKLMADKLLSTITEQPL